MTFLFVFLLSVKLSCTFFTNKESGSVSVCYWISFLWELVSIQNLVPLTVFYISWSKKWNDALLTFISFSGTEKHFCPLPKQTVADRRLVVRCKDKPNRKCIYFWLLSCSIKFCELYFY